MQAVQVTHTTYRQHKKAYSHDRLDGKTDMQAVQMTHMTGKMVRQTSYRTDDSHDRLDGQTDVIQDR